MSLHTVHQQFDLLPEPLSANQPHVTFSFVDAYNKVLSMTVTAETPAHLAAALFDLLRDLQGSSVTAEPYMIPANIDVMELTFNELTAVLKAISIGGGGAQSYLTRYPRAQALSLVLQEFRSPMRMLRARNHNNTNAQ